MQKIEKKWLRIEQGNWCRFTEQKINTENDEKELDSKFSDVQRRDKNHIAKANLIESLKQAFSWNLC